MAIRLPKDGPPEQTESRPRSEPLQSMDTVEYGLTVEVSLEHNRKAWVKFGTNAAVREGETTEQAITRITNFVNQGIDDRLDDLS